MSIQINDKQKNLKNTFIRPKQEKFGLKDKLTDDNIANLLIDLKKARSPKMKFKIDNYCNKEGLNFNKY
jgi:hypothetical protein